jgi:hypothetical protein
MKTAMASPDEGPDKKKFGIPKKDKKGLAKKTEYEYKSESMSNKKKLNPKSKDDAKPKDKDGQNIRRSREEKNPHKPMDYTKRDTPKNPKPTGEDHGRKKTKDYQFEKSYKVVPNKLKTKEDLNKKDAPSTKKGKQ